MKHAILFLLLSLPWLTAAVEPGESLRARTRGKVTGYAIRATWPENRDQLIYSLQPPHDGQAHKWRVDLDLGTREPMAPNQEPDFLEWQAPGSCRPGSRGRETEIQFMNQSSRIIELYWQERRDHRELYGILAPGETRTQHTYAGHAWVITDTNQQAIACLVADAMPGTARITQALCDHPPEPVPESARPRRNRRRGQSPDGRWNLRFEENNAVLETTDGAGARVALTADGTADHGYHGPPHWSPDSRFVVFTRRRDPEMRRVTMIASSPEDQLQPRIESYGYRKPGDEISQETPVLFRVADPSRVVIADDRFPNPWSLHDFHWAPDSGEFFFDYNQRGHQLYRVLAVNPTNGAVRTIIEEQSKTFIDYSNKIDGRHLDPTNEMLWMSERDGWNHLYLVNRTTGEARQLTRGPWVVRGIDLLDEESRTVRFRVVGIDPDQDPYHVHYARIGLDGSGFTRLTEGEGTHHLEFSPDRRHYIDSWSKVDQAPIHELRRSADGALVRALGRADDQALRATGWIAPEPFSAKGRDGATDIWGIIYRPTHLDTSLRYPVIESIYAGPHDQHVPKRFAAFREAQALAEKGFIVVQIDGMGTNWRSKAFHDVAWKNLKDAGFPDRIAWMRAAAERYPYLDLSRVGVYGTSAGGQNAMRAVLDHHDVYRAAVADCGCHDNRMDKIWWNEAWMGWPVDESYAQSSNVVDAHKLDGALLLMVGELDRNVDPASTLQVVDALIKADKDFELIVFPGKGHGAGSGPYGRRRLYEFFDRQLGPTQPGE